jgi:hypothetical protein
MAVHCGHTDKANVVDKRATLLLAQLTDREFEKALAAPAPKSKKSDERRRRPANRCSR